MHNHLSTERLFLDILTPEDDAFIIHLLNSPGWLKFVGDRKVHSKEEAAAYIHKILTTENLFYWVVRTKKSGFPIGIISFLKRASLDHYDIGFAFLPEYHGCGYAYEAAKEVISMTSQKSASKPILAVTKPDNMNSIKLLLKLGLHFKEEQEEVNEKIHIYSNDPGA